jgi:hypothetical protein
MVAKLFDKPGFSDTGLADDKDKLSIAGKSAFRAARSRPTKGVRSREPLLRRPLIREMR